MKLWKGNRLDGEYTLTTEEIVDGFLASPFADMSMPMERALNLYIADDDTGLGSTWGDPQNSSDLAEFDTVFDAVVEKIVSNTTAQRIKDA